MQKLLALVLWTTFFTGVAQADSFDFLRLPRRPFLGEFEIRDDVLLTTIRHPWATPIASTWWATSGPWSPLPLHNDCFNFSFQFSDLVFKIFQLVLTELSVCLGADPNSFKHLIAQRMKTSQGLHSDRYFP